MLYQQNLGILNSTTVPLIVIIGKIDSAGLTKEVGNEAIKQLMAQKQETFTDYYDTQDYLCRRFSIDNDIESFINSIDIKFKDNRYFAYCN